MGGTPRSNVLVGGELIGWTASEGSTDVSRGNAMLSVFFYPSVPTGVYIRGGIGFAGRSATTDIDLGGATASLSQDEGGLGMAGGVGWDIRLANNFYLTPAADFLLQVGMDDQSSLLLFTVGATWH